MVVNPEPVAPSVGKKVPSSPERAIKTVGRLSKRSSRVMSNEDVNGYLRTGEGREESKSYLVPYWL